MFHRNAGRDDGISIGWVKLADLNAVPVNHGCAGVNQPKTWHRRVTSSVDLSASLGSLPDRADSDNCNAYAAISMFASVSSIFSRGLRGKRKESNGVAAANALQMVAYTPARGTYAYETLQHRFKEFDKGGSGYISEGDLKLALIRLNLPASEQDVQAFMNHVVDTARTNRITFEKFAEYAINRENELFETFKELDKRKIGYITMDDLMVSFRKYKFRGVDKDIKKMVSKLDARVGLLRSQGFYNHRQVLDFGDFRNFMMLATAKDLRDIFEIWGRAVIDLGDVDTSFPLSSGRYNKRGVLGQHRPKQKVFQHLLAGALSGAVSRTVAAPLERLKVLSMVDREIAKNGFSCTFSKIWREEAIGGFFKGNFLNVLRIAPTKVLEFWVYDNLKDLVLKTTEQVDISRIQRMVLGSIASMAGTFISHPIDTVRTVITVQTSGVRTGVIEFTKCIVESEGFPGLYRGIVPNMIRIAPYATINFIVYEQLKQWYRTRVGPGGDLGVLPTVFFSVLAGALAQTAVYPLETVQRRLQAQAVQRGTIIYQNMIDAFRLIIQEEGVKSLYAGLLPNYLKLVPAATVSFLLYEYLKEKLDFKE